MIRSSSTRRRYRDFALYLLAGITVAGFGIWWGIHTADTNISPALPLDWLQFAAMTALVFGNTLRQFWEWRSVRLWVTLGAILAVHLSVSIPVIYAFHPVPILWILLVALAEQVAISKVMARVIVARESEKHRPG